MKKFAIKCETVTEAKEVIKKLVEHGYKEDVEWNSFFESSKKIYVLYVEHGEGLSIHNHDGCYPLTTLEDLISVHYAVRGCEELVEYFRNKDIGGWTGDSPDLFYFKNGEYWYTEEADDYDDGKFTEVPLDKYLQIINETPNTTMKNVAQPTTAKPMSITKTETVLIGKKKREITITILTTKDNPFKVQAGYSVRNPEDKKSNPELAKQISTGRALSDKTNMVDMYLGEGMQNKKYILYAIAEQLFRELSSGTREIKGVK